MVVITLEGVDNTGKTSVINFLVRKNNFKAIKVPQEGFLPYTKKYINEIRSTETLSAFLFYQAANAYTTLYVSNLFKDDQKGNIVLNRFINTTYASCLVADRMFNDGMNVATITELFEKDKNKFLIPDLTVFLYADEHARKSRMLLRTERSKADLEFDNACQQELRRIAKSLKAPNKVLELDTSTSTEEEIGLKIIRKLDE